MRRYHHSDSVAAPPPGWGRVEWVLARPCYRYKRFDLKQVPRASRAAALALQLPQWTPFARSGYYVAWSEGVALAFCWDAERVEQALAAQSLKPGKARVVPETVLRPPAADGARLLACLQGCEGQIWTGGQLAQSRWWKSPPSADEWLAFQRDAGRPPQAQQAEAPAALELPLAEAPWAKAGEAWSWGGGRWRDEKLAYFALALLLAPPTAWQAARLRNYHLAAAQLQADYDALQQAAGPVADARGRALQARARVQELQAIDPYPGQLELMAWVAETLLRPGDRLAEWDYHDGRLKITLAAAADIQSTSTLVNTLQLSGLFDNVHTRPGKTPKNITLEMDVLPRHAAPTPGHV